MAAPPEAAWHNYHQTLYSHQISTIESLAQENGNHIVKISTSNAIDL